MLITHCVPAPVDSSNLKRRSGSENRRSSSQLSIDQFQLLTHTCMLHISFSCRACGQHPFPSRQLWPEDIDRNLKLCPNTLSKAESYLVQLIVDELKTYVGALQKELETANEAYKYGLTLLSPICEVSDDILLCIFQALFTPSTDQRLNASDVAPFTRVCKRWRNIITSTPRFWTRISFPRGYKLHSAQQPPNASLRRYFSTQLDRAGTLPLTVECNSVRGLSALSLRALEPGLARVESLELTHAYEGIDGTAESYSLLPNLRRLALNIHKPHSFNYKTGSLLSDRRPVTINLRHHDIPQLTHFELNMNNPLENITLPWAQLTKLKIHLRTGGSFDLYSIFGELEKVEDMEINFGMHYQPVGSIGRSDVTLPRLHTLALEGDQKDELSFWLLGQANIPSLRTLSYALDQGHQWLVQSLNTPQLWTILILRLDFHSWTSPNSTADEIDEVLNSLWECKCLEIFSCRVRVQHSSRIFQTLSLCEASRGWLLPGLRNLEIARAPLHRETLASLQALLESRVSGIDIPTSARKALRIVDVSLEQEYNRFKHKKHELPRREWKPLRYNDRVTSVRIEIKGELPAGFSERLSEFCLD